MALSTGVSHENFPVRTLFASFQLRVRPQEIHGDSSGGSTWLHSVQSTYLIYSPAESFTFVQAIHRQAVSAAARTYKMILVPASQVVACDAEADFSP
eukprot:6212457-Pleurochrysis_carterae.AAC.5